MSRDIYSFTKVQKQYGSLNNNISIASTHIYLYICSGCSTIKNFIDIDQLMPFLFMYLTSCKYICIWKQRPKDTKFRNRKALLTFLISLTGH